MNYPVKNGLILSLCLCLAALLSPGSRVKAEGSKEVNANGGSRAFLVSGTNVTESFIFPTVGTMKVYAKAGEAIYVGSSVQGNGAGTINLRAPNGSTYTSGTNATVGLIANHAQELAGPLPNAGGYSPYIRSVAAAEAGVWEIDFVSQNGGAPSNNVIPIPAANDWVQTNGQYIAAFDISVRNAANTAFLTGRVYTNLFSGMLGTFDVGFNGIFRVLTKDGYLYILDNNGQAGNGFSFFSNNKGFRQANGSPSYTSINSLANPNIQDPRAADTPTDITYKIFFNDPAADLPATAPTPGGGTTWLLNPVAEPTLTAFAVSGKEGLASKVGSFPLGALMTFNANKNGNFLISIDINNNGVFTDAVDRKITGQVLAGQNQVTWDGLDGLGNKVSGGNYNANLNVVLYGGEVHFPFFDVERNVNGLKLTRTNGFQSPDYTVYWDDSPIQQSGTPSSPIANKVSGGDSRTSGHKWGTTGVAPIDFGDQRGLDTWAYIAATPLVATAGFQVSEADLEVTGISTTGVSGTCAGQYISYTVPVKNNGPSDVTGARFAFAFPNTLTDITVSSVQTAGTTAVGSETTTATGYSALLNLSNGAIRTFTITGKVTGAPGGTTIAVTASILRPAGVADPDATNPDNAVPTDPQLECDALPSGPGCNNIKTITLSFLGSPAVIGPQAIFQGQTVTLTDAGAGTWSVAAANPGTATIAAPTALTTTVSGFNNTGVYHILRTNALGCVADVPVTVLSANLNIPTVMTPNGDGKNDTFAVPGILTFPGSELVIVNRWGNEVYKSSNYQNTWTGEGLPEGTYYYTLKKRDPVNGSFTTYKGWVFLKR